MTLSATPTTVTFGGSTKLAGQVRHTPAGASVSLQEDPYPYDGAYQTAAQVTPGPSGSFSFPRVPVRHTRYRVLVSGQPQLASPSPTVTVKLRVSLATSTTSPRRGARVRFAGYVSPAHLGTRVSVQRKSSSGVWSTVARTRALASSTARSRYVKYVRVYRSAAYRVRVSGDADHAANVSPERLLSVR